MRLKWVRKRLERWAVWREACLYGRVASPMIDGMPHAAAFGAVVTETRTEEEETDRALRALQALYPDYGTTIALVYWVGPAVHKVRLTELAEWIGITKYALAMRVERAESKFSEMLEKARDARDLVL